MPTAALRPCTWPGCNALVSGGRCGVHSSGNIKKDPDVKKLYNSKRWQSMRARQLAGYPWCAECLKDGRYVPATEVDHVERHRGDPEKFYNKVVSVMPLPKGMKAEDRVNDLVTFEMLTDINNEEKLKALWPFQRKLIEQSFEWKKFYGTKTVSEVIEIMIQNDPQSAPMTDDAEPLPF